MKLVVDKYELPTVITLGYPTVRRLMLAGKFPLARQLSDGRVGWVMSEIQDWLTKRPVASGGLRGEQTRLRKATDRERARKPGSRKKKAAMT